jgi:arginine-tRNA-protein transferase
MYRFSVLVNSFKPTRSQRRAMQKHQHLTAKVLPLEFIPEHFELYQTYLHSRHQTTDENSENEDLLDQYKQFLIQSNIQSYLVEFRENSILRMVSVIDQVADGISSVYTFFRH